MATSLIGISFDFTGLCYYQTNKDVEIGSLVVCNTPHGNYIGKVSKIRKPTEKELNNPDFETLYPPVLRMATFQDQRFAEENKDKEIEISRMTQQEADLLSLDMKVLKSYLDVEDSKVLITFIADGRIDFRELVKILNGIFHLRIELRQIGPRDKARLVGGIGLCGLPICCSVFLKSFDGISIAMAKNQLLVINIPKLSGQCGKLMCCLKYEDETYTEIRPLYPKIGEKITYKNSTYEVSSINILNDTITLYNGSNYEYFTKEQLERVKNGLEKTEEVVFKDINSGVDLSGFGLNETNNRINKIKIFEEKHIEDIKNAKEKKTKNKPTTKNNRYYTHTYQNKSKKDSGFIPVSQIADKEVLSIKGVVKKEDDNK